MVCVCLIVPNNTYETPRSYPYLDVVVGFAWSYDPESYAGGSVATGSASHARQVKGDDPDKKGYPSPPCWGLGMGLTNPPHNNYILLKSFQNWRDYFPRRRRLLKRSAQKLSTSRNVLSSLRSQFSSIFCGIFNDIVSDSGYIAVACSYTSFESSNLEDKLGNNRPLIK